MNSPPLPQLSQQQLAITLVVILLTTYLYLNKRVRQIIQCLVSRHQISVLKSKRDDNPVVGKVSHIYIYPVKSLQAISVPSISFDSIGFQHDRHFMIVRPTPTPLRGSFLPHEPTHRFFTQRQSPSLATISTSLNNTSSSSSSATTLTLSSPHNDKSLTIPIPPTINSSSQTYLAGIWSSTITVVDVGDDAAKFIQTIATRDDPSHSDVRLVYLPPKNATTTKIPPPSTLHTDEDYTPSVVRRSYGTALPRVSLNDGFPILIACEASLRELNDRLEKKGKERVDMTNFRPNIVIDGPGSEAFAEDRWKAIMIGDDNVLHVVKGCPRCKQSCTDQKTGLVREEPLETLGDFRMAGAGNDVYFAVNAVTHDECGVLRVGDEVRVLTEGEPVWDKKSVQAE